MPSVMGKVKCFCENENINNLAARCSGNGYTFMVAETDEIVSHNFGFFGGIIGLKPATNKRYTLYIENTEMGDTQLIGIYNYDQIELLLDMMSQMKNVCDILYIDLIKKLSIDESNSLTRRMVKAQEELGELAEAVLCVDDPNGTSYKQLSVEDIKEECVDVILVVLSVFFDKRVKGTLRELSQLIHKKCTKWEETSTKKTKGKTNVE